MKIIFSRKGFDSTAGGFPSIIFPNREMYSIPIPSKFDRDLYSEIVYKYDNYPIQKILNDITEGNRLVGIISHVSDLKEKIEKQIVVTKDKSGKSTVKII